MNASISKNNQNSYNRTFGMNKDIGKVNAKIGLTVEVNKSSESISASASANSSKLTLTTGDINYGIDNKSSFSTMSCSASGSLTKIPGYMGSEYSAKASIVEVSNTTTVKLGPVEINVNTEIGIGTAIGAKVGSTNSAEFSTGFVLPAIPGTYAGISVDVKF